MAASDFSHGHAMHRSVTLTDGIYAVAMTLLVIELRVPDHAAIHGADDLARALVQLTPKVIAWVISFFVLAQFWFGHHRTFNYVDRGDGILIALNVTQLGFVSLMPFSSALSGEYPEYLLSQVIYSLNMAILAVISLLISRRVHRHPEWTSAPMPLGVYRGARVRIIGLCVISAAAVAIAMIVPRAGNVAFVLMAVIMPMSHRIEARTPVPDAFARGDYNPATPNPPWH